jgi:hypothetical protein
MVSCQSAGRSNRHVRRILLALATATAPQTIDCDDNIGPLEYLNQPIKKALVVMRFRLEIFFEDALCVAHGLKR